MVTTAAPPNNTPSINAATGQTSKAWSNYHDDVSALANAAATKAQPVLQAPVTIDGPPATVRELAFTSSGKERWGIAVMDNPETGGGGSDLRIRRYADDGTTLSEVVLFSRLDGSIQVNSTVYFAAAVTLAGNIGFHGAAPVAKPTVTGSLGSTAWAGSLTTALTACGLISY